MLAMIWLYRLILASASHTDSRLYVVTWASSTKNEAMKIYSAFHCVALCHSSGSLRDASGDIIKYGWLVHFQLHSLHLLESGRESGRKSFD